MTIPDWNALPESLLYCQLASLAASGLPLLPIPIPSQHNQLQSETNTDLLPDRTN